MANRGKKPTKSFRPTDQTTDDREMAGGNRGNRKNSRNSSAKRNRNDRSSMDRSRSSKNDVSWYSRNPNLLLSAGTIPYPYRPGMAVPVYSDNLSTTLFQQIPGALAIEWMPSVGFSTKNTDPISVAAKEIYARVRESYSGSLEADPPDFIMYIMALDSVYAYIAWLKRVFRTINAYSSENFFTPDGLLTAYGFDVGAIQELRINKMQLWQAINTLVLQTRKFKCPALMDVINRHYWLSDNIYMDAEFPNAQFYVFNPRAFYMFSSDIPEPVTPTNTVDGLQYVLNPCYALDASSGDWLQSGQIVQRLYDFGEMLISALVAWDSGYTIAGYLDRAYKDVPSFVVDEIDYNAVLEPVYSAEVLMQIENSYAMLYQFPNDFAQANAETMKQWFPVSQLVSENAIYSQPYAGFPNVASDLAKYLKVLVNVHAPNPTVADSVVATRLHAAIDLATPLSGWATTNYALFPGTELVYKFVLITPSGESADGNPYLTQDFTSLNIYYTDTQTPKLNETIGTLGSLSHFDWHPFWILMFVERTTAIPQSVTVHGDIQNVTSVTQDMLKNLNTVCLYSEFNAFNY